MSGSTPFVNPLRMLLLLLCIALLGYGAFSLRQSAHTRSQQRDDTKDAFATGVTMVQTDEDGHLTRRLIARHISHISKHNTSFYQNPQITFYRMGKMPWRIQAAHGKAIEGETLIHLWQQVRLQQDKGPHNKATLITSDTLYYRPKTGLAYTPAHVTLRQLGFTLHAHGLKSYTHEGKTILMSKVRGHYDPAAS